MKTRSVTRRNTLVAVAVAALATLALTYGLVSSRGSAAADTNPTVPTTKQILAGQTATGPELAAQLGLEGVKAEDLAGRELSVACQSWVGVSEDIGGYCIGGLTEDSVDLYILGLALRDMVPSQEEYERIKATIISGEAGDAG